MKTIPSKELKKRISIHEEWQESNGQKGERLVLIDADLSGADLGHSNLRCADFNHSNLSGASLSHADLTCATLPKKMKNYTVKGLVGFDEAVKNLDQIREQVLESQEILEMNYWNSPFGTTHCLAGLAQINAGLKNNVEKTIDGSKLIWPACHMFFKSNKKVIEFLENREYAR